MQIVAHRINTLETLRKLPTKYGCEIDIRSYGSELILSHDPFIKGDLFTNFLSEYRHGLLILNIKESGIEDYILEEVKRYSIKDYFLLDVEFPYLYKASRKGIHSIAIRYSEEESIEMVNNYKHSVDWVWIDTFTKLPLDEKNVRLLKELSTCLVCPERWNRPYDIMNYRFQMQALDFIPDAVMTDISCIPLWEKKI